MKVIIFGASGMVGQGVLRECLNDGQIKEVYTVSRTSLGISHPKLHELLHSNFCDFSKLKLEADACYWCLGISSAGVSEADYTRVTHDFTLAAAKVLAQPSMTFIFVSAAGAQGKAMWARVKRRTEDALFALPFRAVYVFRPGMIQALHGIKSRTSIYNILYSVLKPLLLLAKVSTPHLVTTTERIGQAMLRITGKGFPQKILDNRAINAAALL